MMPSPPAPPPRSLLPGNNNDARISWPNFGPRWPKQNDGQERLQLARKAEVKEAALRTLAFAEAGAPSAIGKARRASPPAVWDEVGTAFIAAAPSRNDSPASRTLSGVGERPPDPVRAVVGANGLVSTDIRPLRHQRQHDGTRGLEAGP